MSWKTILLTSVVCATRQNKALLKKFCPISVNRWREVVFCYKNGKWKHNPQRRTRAQRGNYAALRIEGNWSNWTSQKEKPKPCGSRFVQQPVHIINVCFVNHAAEQERRNIKYSTSISSTAAGQKVASEPLLGSGFQMKERFWSWLSLCRYCTEKPPRT